eukprot:6283015-Amphidinium_carterae.1
MTPVLFSAIFRLASRSSVLGLHDRSHFSHQCKRAGFMSYGMDCESVDRGKSVQKLCKLRPRHTSKTPTTRMHLVLVMPECLHSGHGSCGVATPAVPMRCCSGPRCNGSNCRCGEGESSC